MARLKHGKRARKVLTYFRAAHGFRPPFDVLLDGTAIQASINHGVDLSDALAKMLCDRVRLHVPRAVVAELHALGRNFAAAAKVARRLRVLDIATPTGKTAAADALLELVAGGNPERRFVLTEDPALRMQLSSLDAVPLIRFARGGRLLLEAPGRHGSLGMGAASDDSGGSLSAATEKPQKRPRADEPASAAGPLGVAQRAEEPARKRKRLKEPNPLSIKKKRRPQPPPAQRQHPQTPANSTEGDGKLKRRKRRHRGGSDMVGAA